MSDSKCCYLIHIKVSQEIGKVVWYFHLFKNFLVCCDPNSQKLYRVVNEAVYTFLEFFSFLYDPTNVGNLISGSSAFSKPTLYIWKFSVYVLLKPKLKEFEYNLAGM